MLSGYSHSIRIVLDQFLRGRLLDLIFSKQSKMSLYLDHYLDSLENLPVELQRNFTLMNDLDTRAQTVMKRIDAMADEYMKHSKSLSSERKKEIMSEIKQQYNKAKEYGDDKVQLSIQTYELVDKHIRRLDSDLARFEAEIHDKANSVSRAKDELLNKTSREKFKEKEKNKKGNVLSEDEGGAKKKKKKTSGKVGGGILTGAKASVVVSPSASPIAGLPLGSGEVLDMPVDPNEPTYCLCHQVSYGEMIGCDNPDCPIEWFHFACVKLTTKPKGKWFCPKCSSERKKK